MLKYASETCFIWFKSETDYTRLFGLFVLFCFITQFCNREAKSYGCIGELGPSVLYWRAILFHPFVFSSSYSICLQFDHIVWRRPHLLLEWTEQMYYEEHIFDFFSSSNCHQQGPGFSVLNSYLSAFTSDDI